jgi:hypothetical protein
MDVYESSLAISGVEKLASASGKLRKSYLSNQLKFDDMIFF